MSNHLLGQHTSTAKFDEWFHNLLCKYVINTVSRCVNKPKCECLLYRRIEYRTGNTGDRLTPIRHIRLSANTCSRYGV